MFKKFTLIIGLTALIMSCTNTITDTEREKKKISVSGFLQTNRTRQMITVYPVASIDASTASIISIPSAVVYLMEQGTKIPFIYDSVRQCHYSDFSPIAGKNYKLFVDNVPIPVHAQTTVPLLPKIKKIDPETLVVDTALPYTNIMNNPGMYPKFFVTIADKYHYVHSVKIASIEPTKISFMKATEVQIRKVGGWVTFNGDTASLDMRRFAYLGRNVIYLQRVDDIFAKYLISSQNQGVPSVDVNQEFNVEDLTLAPSNIKDGLGIFTSLAVDTFEVFIRPK